MSSFKQADFNMTKEEFLDYFSETLEWWGENGEEIEVLAYTKEQSEAAFEGYQKMKEIHNKIVELYSEIGKISNECKVPFNSHIVNTNSYFIPEGLTEEQIVFWTDTGAPEFLDIYGFQQPMMHGAYKAGVWVESSR